MPLIVKSYPLSFLLVGTPTDELLVNGVLPLYSLLSTIAIGPTASAKYFSISEKVLC